MRSIVPALRSVLLAQMLLSASATAQTANPSAPSTKPSPFATATLSGGCYWTMETVFEHTRGVVDVVSGLTGSSVGAASYLRDPTHTHGATESVRITYDPSQISYEQLLKVYFTAAHDPREVDRQGPDAGARYRSVVWFADDAQKTTALSYISSIETGKAKVATQVAPVADFHPVPESEQDFAEKNPQHPYIRFWDVPRLERYRKSLPEFFRERDARL